MKQIEYNLLEERWVRVRGQDYTVQEVSLPDALLHAHEYRDLAGELPTQDAAMLRLLLAVLPTVFSRVDGAVARPLLAFPPGTPLLAGAGSEDRKPIPGQKIER